MLVATHLVHSHILDSGVDGIYYVRRGSKRPWASLDEKPSIVGAHAPNDTAVSWPRMLDSGRSSWILMRENGYLEVLYGR
jgi:hypothetical protein